MQEETPRNKILKDFISKNDLIETILKGEDYEVCCWYNKKTGVFCNKKVCNLNSYHSHYKILYCVKCSEKKKMNDLIEVLKQQSSLEENNKGIYKTKGVPILPLKEKKEE